MHAVATCTFQRVFQAERAWLAETAPYQTGSHRGYTVASFLRVSGFFPEPLPGTPIWQAGRPRRVRRSLLQCCSHASPAFRFGADCGFDFVTVLFVTAGYPRDFVPLPDPLHRWPGSLRHGGCPACRFRSVQSQRDGTSVTCRVYVRSEPFGTRYIVPYPAYRIP